MLASDKDLEELRLYPEEIREGEQELKEKLQNLSIQFEGSQKSKKQESTKEETVEAKPASENRQ